MLKPREAFPCKGRMLKLKVTPNCNSPLWVLNT